MPCGIYLLCHVVYICYAMWYIFVMPCGIYLLCHVVYICYAMWYIFVMPYGIYLLCHVVYMCLYVECEIAVCMSFIVYYVSV